jgi:hypothetical protein
MWWNALSMVLRYLSTMPANYGLPALVRAKPAKGSALAGGSIFSTARASLLSWGSWVPRYSVPRSMRTRGTAPFSTWKGKDPAVSKIGRRHDRRLAIMELGEAGLGIGVDEGLPIDLANPFQRANREGVPRAAKPKTFAFELCLSLFSGNLSARLERFPITWNHVINKEPLRIKELDHAGIEKVDQLFLDMLQLPRRKSSFESRTPTPRR